MKKATIPEEKRSQWRYGKPGKYQNVAPMRGATETPARLGWQPPMTLALKNGDKRSIFLVADNRDARYRLPKSTVNPVVGRRNPISKRRNSAQITTVGVFFRLQFRVMAAVCGQASAWPGSFCPGIPTPRTAATQSRRKDCGSSSSAKGARPMHTINPSELKDCLFGRVAAAIPHASLSVRALSGSSECQMWPRRSAMSTAQHPATTLSVRARRYSANCSTDDQHHCVETSSVQLALPLKAHSPLWVSSGGVK